MVQPFGDPNRHPDPERRSSLKPPSSASVQLRLEIHDKLKDAFASWATDIALPPDQGPLDMSQAMRELERAQRSRQAADNEKLSEALGESLDSEILMKALTSEDESPVESATEEVMDRVEHELAIVRNQTKLGHKRTAGLLSKDVSEQREAYRALFLRQLGFALGDEDYPPVFDAIGPLVLLVQALGNHNINEEVKTVVEDYRKQMRFRPPVFREALERIIGDGELAECCRSGASREVWMSVIRDASRKVYPTREDFVAAREACPSDPQMLLSAVFEVFKRSGNSFAAQLATMVGKEQMQPGATSRAEEVLAREIEMIYGCRG